MKHMRTTCLTLAFVLWLSLLAGCQRPEAIPASETKAEPIRLAVSMDAIGLEMAVTGTSEAVIVYMTNTSFSSVVSNQNSVPVSSSSSQPPSVSGNSTASSAPVTGDDDTCQLIKENGKFYTIQCKRNGNGIKASVGNIRSICWACGLTVDPDGTIVKAGGTSSPGSLVSGVARVDTSAYADEVLRLINKERANAGLDELIEDSYLSEVARERCEEIVNNFSHTRPDGTTVGDLGLGENCHYGRTSPQWAVDAWMDSAGHKANILNEEYVSFGAGCCQAESGNLFWVVTFRKS